MVSDDKNKMPEYLVKKGLELAKGLLYYGSPVESFSKEELIAAFEIESDNNRKQMLERKRLDFLSVDQFKLDAQAFSKRCSLLESI